MGYKASPTSYNYSELIASRLSTDAKSMEPMEDATLARPMGLREPKDFKMNCDQFSSSCSAFISYSSSFSPIMLLRYSSSMLGPLLMRIVSPSKLFPISMRSS